MASSLQFEGIHRLFGPLSGHLGPQDVKLGPSKSYLGLWDSHLGSGDSHLGSQNGHIKPWDSQDPRVYTYTEVRLIVTSP